MLFHIDSFDYSNTDLNKRRVAWGIIKAIEFAKNNSTNQILIYVDELGTLNGFIKDIDEENIKNLIKSRHIILNDVDVFLQARNTASAFKKGVLLAIFPKLQNLNSWLTNYRVTDSIYIPSSTYDCSKYIEINKDSEKLTFPEE